jgi:hypothetical protein
MKLFYAALLYFLLLFLLGFLLGPIRMFYIQPYTGKLLAILLEAPLLLGAMPWAAAFCIHLFNLSTLVGERLAMGLIALFLLIGAELLGSRLLLHMSVVRYLRQLRTPYGIAGSILKLIFAIMPTVLLY